MPFPKVIAIRVSQGFALSIPKAMQITLPNAGRNENIAIQGPYFFTKT
jgi:hypothetical protein